VLDRARAEPQLHELPMRDRIMLASSQGPGSLRLGSSGRHRVLEAPASANSPPDSLSRSR
jgi:hypothetical protein